MESMSDATIGAFSSSWDCDGIAFEPWTKWWQDYSRRAPSPFVCRGRSFLVSAVAEHPFYPHLLSLHRYFRLLRRLKSTHNFYNCCIFFLKAHIILIFKATSHCCMADAVGGTESISGWSLRLLQKGDSPKFLGQTHDLWTLHRQIGAPQGLRL